MSVFKKKFNANSNLPDKCHLKNYYLDIVIRSSALLTITQICFDEIWWLFLHSLTIDESTVPFDFAVAELWDLEIPVSFSHVDFAHEENCNFPWW